MTPRLSRISAQQCRPFQLTPSATRYSSATENRHGTLIVGNRNAWKGKLLVCPAGQKSFDSAKRAAVRVMVGVTSRSRVENTMSRCSRYGGGAVPGLTVRN